ncbi:MAG: LTA synthase family protein [Proteobacteria bacterium]|nr:LTA synthase family protein [Pseudomonadota bacterium]MBU1648036.1 LTA synthase family protein [Pseudomonadota bacterium]
MRKIYAAVKNSRFGMLALFGIVYMAISTLLRIVLLISSWEVSKTTFGGLGQIFFIGTFYDVVFCIYVSVFFSFLLLFLPQALYRSKVYKYTTFLFAFLLLYGAYCVTFAEWLFWNEFNTRFNFISIDYLMYTDEVARNVYESYPVLPIFVGLFLASALTFAMLKPALVGILQVREKFSGRLTFAASIFTLALCSYLFVGQSLRGLSDNNYINELGSNGPYQFVAAFRNNTLDYKTFYPQGSEAELSRRLKESVGKKNNEGALFDISRDVVPTKNTEKLNVILISVESLSAEFLTRFGQKEDITPFMDQMFEKGLFFTNFYATGTRTTRGLESITLSLPPTPGRSLVKRPDNAKIYNLGKVFKDNGYDVAFLYGGRGFFDNMNAFFSGNGYRTVDQSDLNADEITFENAWGVADEDIYRRAIAEANVSYAAGKPFFYHIMTTSNHRPYTYPEGKIDIPSGTGRSGGVKYTDYALRQLITSSEKQKWYNDTVFVIVADHCAAVAGRAELPVERYHIPLLIYSPGHINAQTVNKLSGQIDIAPTLLALLGIRYESHFFGQDILSDTFQERALISNYQRLGVYENDELTILAPVKQMTVIKDPLHNEQSIPADPKNGNVLETMALYQGADFILKRRLNRWKEVEVKDTGRRYL